MLFLMFHIGSDRFVLDAEQVERVLPLMEAKSLPGAPPEVVGVINYRGAPTPLIDLSRVALGRPSKRLMSTRIILARYPGERESHDRLALCAERVIKTIHRDPADFVATGVEAGSPAHLGPVASDADGFIQWVRVEALLADEVRDLLFQRAEASA